jgi:hypothetical protein
MIFEFCLEIVEVRGLNVVDTRKNGFLKAFVTARFVNHPKKKYQTHVCPKSRAPQWNESFNVQFEVFTDVLEFQLWEKQSFSKKFLGAAFLPLTFFKTGTTEFLLPLEEFKNASLFVRVSMTLSEQSLNDEFVLPKQKLSSPLLLPESHFDGEQIYLVKQTIFSYDTQHRLSVLNEQGKEVLQMSYAFPYVLGPHKFRYNVEYDGIHVLSIDPQKMEKAEIFSIPDNEGNKYSIAKVSFSNDDPFKSGFVLERDGAIVLFKHDERIVNAQFEPVAYCIPTRKLFSVHPVNFYVKCAQGTDHMLTLLFLCASEIAKLFKHVQRVHDPMMRLTLMHIGPQPRLSHTSSSTSHYHVPIMNYEDVDKFLDFCYFDSHNSPNHCHTSSHDGHFSPSHNHHFPFHNHDHSSFSHDHHDHSFSSHHHGHSSHDHSSSTHDHSSFSHDHSSFSHGSSHDW